MQTVWGCLMELSSLGLETQNARAGHGLASGLARQNPSSSLHPIFVSNLGVHNVEHFVIQPQLQLCLLRFAKE